MEKVAIELSDAEKSFLIALLKDVVPTLTVPAKDAAGILAASEAILEKLKKGIDG